MAGVGDTNSLWGRGKRECILITLESSSTVRVSLIQGGGIGGTLHVPESGDNWGRGVGGGGTLHVPESGYLTCTRIGVPYMYQNQGIIGGGGWGVGVPYMYQNQGIIGGGGWGVGVPYMYQNQTKGLTDPYNNIEFNYLFSI